MRRSREESGHGDSTPPLALGRRGAFWTAACVLALVLWSSGAPSVLYPIYAQRWDLSALVVTMVFATYQLALLVVLPVFGNLSDQFGRRLVMIGGVALLATSAIVFALAPHVSFLFLGRALQGAGSGLAMGAATASLVENNTTGNPRVAGSLASIATAVGLTFALILSGVFAQFLPLPLFWSYIVLLALIVGAAIALALTPDDRPVRTRARHRQALHLDPSLRLSFSVAALSVSLAYCVGAIVLSLGAQMIEQFAQTSHSSVVGLLLGSSAVAIGITALLLSRVHPLTAVWTGSLLTVASLVLMVAASAFGSLALFLCWCVVGGVAYAVSFTGGLGVINQAAPVHRRGASLSLVYLVAYALQIITAVGTGAIATAGTLTTAVLAAAIALAGLCLVLLVLTVVAARRAAQERPPTADPSAGPRQ